MLFEVVFNGFAEGLRHADTAADVADFEFVPEIVRDGELFARIAEVSWHFYQR